MEELQNRQKASNRMAIIIPHLSIIALKHGLNSPIKRDRVEEKKQDPTIYCLCETHFTIFAKIFFL